MEFVHILSPLLKVSLAFKSLIFFLSLFLFLISDLFSSNSKLFLNFWELFDVDIILGLLLWSFVVFLFFDFYNSQLIDEFSWFLSLGFWFQHFIWCASACLIFASRFQNICLFQISGSVLLGGFCFLFRVLETMFSNL